ncbi:conserved hypothetical protein [Uncinocarpus reesii 1704]|uniref:UBC core domain-containing protein n=1 Tax=Uncinocarpus reesii (strain UAMH 1704) TaxID=336963 RepID=C4JUM0_UNCRE|nr:uncharacterized protein UREG_04823 [Uncinocarpus reesii 1704]EEP79981.1 conserved hypothetical protein [Uncinocarpus reesii 1704]
MAAPGPTLRRLVKEAQELSESSPSPSPYFHAHPISDSNLFDWHFTLAGPPEPSPYANGIYHGRIILSPQYPLRPPSFRFLTPSGRFEVNREICLSISGHHDETWQPAWGIRTALTAIRSFMDGDPRGQVGGVEAKEEVRRDWARRSREWRCDVCPGRKTNEEILKEWWEVCKSKGVAVEDQEDRAVQGDKVPEGLKASYKDEKAKKTDTEAQSEKGISSSQKSQPQSQETERGSNIASESVRAPVTPSAHASMGPAQSTPVSFPAAKRTQVQTSQTQPATTTASTASRATQTTADPWLDRAILGVIMALVLMVLKKIFYANSSEEHL